jgi:hypothetical protein
VPARLNRLSDGGAPDLVCLKVRGEASRGVRVEVASGREEGRRSTRRYTVGLRQVQVVKLDERSRLSIMAGR